MMNRQGRATSGTVQTGGKGETFTGNRGLQLEEPLLFEIGSKEQCGVDLPEEPGGETRLGTLERSDPIGLPGLSEPETMRHYVRLSQKNFSIDSGLYPLGSERSNVPSRFRVWYRQPATI